MSLTLLPLFILFVLVYALVSLRVQSKRIDFLEKENANASKVFIESINELARQLKE